MVNFFIISIVNSSCNTELHVTYQKNKLWLTAKKLPLMDWSGNTSDLDPIANLLNVMENKVAKKDTPSIQKLKTAILEVWTRDSSLIKYI